MSLDTLEFRQGLTAPWQQRRQKIIEGADIWLVVGMRQHGQRRVFTAAISVRISRRSNLAAQKTKLAGEEKRQCLSVPNLSAEGTFEML